jgi:glutamate 5-kinase
MKKRLVIKLGTGVLSSPEGKSLDQAQFTRLSAEIAELQNEGYACIMVSSAAIAAGVRVLKLKKRPDDLPGKQACAAAGQPELMRLYTASFKKHGLNVAQLLLTHGDIDSLMHRENARNTLDRLIEHGVIPIINENDSVAVEELRFGDNDRLSSEVATLIQADRLIILTSTDGLMDHHGERVPSIRGIAEAFQFVRPDKGEESTGGMKTKLEAVRKAISAGISCHIIDGRIANRMNDALAGKDVGTAFGK